MPRKLVITMDLHGTVKAVQVNGKAMRLTPGRLVWLWCALQWRRLHADSRFVRSGDQLVGREDSYDLEE